MTAKRLHVLVTFTHADDHQVELTSGSVIAKSVRQQVLSRAACGPGDCTVGADGLHHRDGGFAPGRKIADSTISGFLNPSLDSVKALSLLCASRDECNIGT
jgi:hypothetical protein